MTDLSSSRTRRADAGDRVATDQPKAWIPALLGVVTFFDSWDSIAIAFVVVSLSTEWNLGSAEIGLLISAGFAGQFFGAIGSGALAEAFGRMRVFIWCGILMSVLAGASAFASGWTMLLILRFIQGIGVGGAMPACITYLSEIAPDRTRGRYISLFQFVTTSGYALAGVASVWIVPNFGWRWMFGLGVMPLAVLPLIYLFVPESPRWLAKRNPKAAAAAIDRLGNGANFVDLLDGAAHAEHVETKRARFADLFARPYRTRTGAICALWFSAASVTFGLATWLPSIYATVYGLPVAQALRYGAIGQGLYLLMPLLVALVIDRWGRRASSIAAFFAGLIALTLLAVIPNPAGILLVALAIIGLNSASAEILILWTYTTEIYPTEIRNLAIGLASGAARFASMIGPTVIGGILTYGSVATVFLCLAACCLAALLVWTFALQETKGRTLN